MKTISSAIFGLSITLIVLLVGECYTNAAPSPIKYIPRRSTQHANLTHGIYGRYWTGNQDQSETIMNLTTSIQSLNLNNLGISYISCSDSSIRLTLNSNESAHDAARHWRKTSSKVLLLLDPDYIPGGSSCSSGSSGSVSATATFYSVSSWRVLSNRIIEFKGAESVSNFSSYVTYYHFVVGSLGTSDSSSISNSRLAERDLVLSATLGPTNISTTISNVFTVKCIKCEVDVALRFKLEISGNIFSNPTINFTTQGSLETHFGVAFGLNASASASITKDLVSVSLSGIDISGILTVGPFVKLYAGAAIYASIDTYFETGFDLVVGDSFESVLTGTSKSGSGSQSGFSPSFTIRNVTNLHINGNVTADLSIGASIGVGITLFGFDLFSVGLRLPVDLTPSLIAAVGSQTTSTSSTKSSSTSTKTSSKTTSTTSSTTVTTSSALTTTSAATSVATSTCALDFSIHLKSDLELFLSSVTYSLVTFIDKDVFEKCLISL